jgi:alpha-mannosidase
LLPSLFVSLGKLVAGNNDYRFLLDGQTLVLEDLLEVAPDFAEQADRLIADGHLIVGPYYCQPDWQLTSGELLIRNLIYGQQDVHRHGGSMDTGWLVDTFGHISQTPQIHRMFGIESVYVWRGVPRLEPYFHWQAADGSQVLAVNLFGGYRNLYGVTHVPEVAVKRLHAEVNKLRPFYPTPDIPLFDGYDLEDDPEDPLTFYAQSNEIGPDVELREATPTTFAREISRNQLPLPTITGELNSGKYGATFPGAFSARTYLKVMARDCQHLLFQICEPLAAMAQLKGATYNTNQYESWGRLLLQNAVHDCICGVSIDQVHEKMEYTYRQVFDGIQADVQASLAAILRDFAPGPYAVSTNPFAAESWQVLNGELVQIQTEGVGIWPVGERIPIEKVNESVESFTWRNEYYVATVGADGVVLVGERAFGSLVVSAENGDTYSEELGERLGIIRPITSLTIVERSAQHCVVAFSSEWRGEKARATATVRLHFDQSPLLRWQIDLDSRGTDLRVEILFETAQQGDIFSGMPFDVVQRPVTDTDLLPRQLPVELANVLLGQRELGAVSTFPYHDFVAVSNTETTVAILAKGIHAYAASADGTVSLTLRRAVEWITKANLQDRIGDAGPFFYVPDGRCERTVRHELAIAIGQFPADSITLQRLNAAFQNPPLIVQGKGNGSQTRWQLLREDMPISSLQIRGDALLARLYNPTTKLQPLSQSYPQTDVWGTVVGNVDAVPPKKIVTVQLTQTPQDVIEIVDVDSVELVWLPQWRVGDNKGLPDTVILARLEENIGALDKELTNIATQISQSHGTERLRLQHRYYILKRERLEFQLSLLLNQRKLAEQGSLRYEYLYQFDDEIASIGFNLNRMRIKRRIFDYVVQAM